MAYLLRNTSFSLFNRVAKSPHHLSLTPVSSFTTPLGVAYFATEAPKRRRRSSTEEKPPKRPGSPYSSFMVEQFPKYKQQNPGVSFVEVSKKLATQWKGLSEVEKKKYAAAYNSRAQKYEKELAAYDKLHPKPPPKPQSPFFLYLAQLRKENPNLKITELAKMGGKKWATVSDAEKKKYEQVYENIKEKYLTEKDNWEKKYGQNETVEKPKKRKSVQ